MLRGTTSSMSRLLSFSGDTPPQTAARIAQPCATTVSGSTDRQSSGSFCFRAAESTGPSPAEGSASRIMRRRRGIIVQPPTSTTSNPSDGSSGTLAIASDASCTARSSNGRTSSSSCSRDSLSVSEKSRLLGAKTSSDTWISTCSASDSRTLASRANCLRRPLRSPSPGPSFALSCISRCSASTSSRSSPPKVGSPLTVRTSKVPPTTSMTETSVVPPPMSNTRTRRVPATRMPYATAAAVLSTRQIASTKPASFAAKRVACLWSALKCAGTPTTAAILGPSLPSFAAPGALCRPRWSLAHFLRT
mmetsp:Transcript_14387/g.54282  ORF Transcript_14387/g.54282 Transcript_14387/m.54282 type:complete len:305 (+) Transcript_14387:631-1545(+)